MKVVAPWLLLLGGAACACTTDLDGLVDDGREDAAPAAGGSDGGDDPFPPPIMEPPIVEQPDDLVDPPGQFAFTLLNGVVDSPAVFFCWVDAGEVSGDPWPEDGLSFGDHVIASDLDGRDAGQEDLALLVVAAEPALIAGEDCASLLARGDAKVTLGGPAGFPGSAPLPLDAGSDAGDAGPSDAGAIVLDAGAPRIRAGFLPVVPAGSLERGGSYLLVVGGCMGGAGLRAPGDRDVCGGQYFADRSTLTPMLVRLSRMVSFGTPSLQFVNASLGSGPVTLRSVPNELQGGTQVTIATDVVAGAIAPYPPLSSVVIASFGAPLRSVALRVVSQLGEEWSSSWGDAMASAGIEDLEALRGYSFVLVGPDPWLQDDSDDPWWQGVRLSMVENSP